jgi:hypothetical protein
MFEQKAANQIRAIARFRNWRLDLRDIYPGRRAPRVALALGYYPTALSGLSVCGFADSWKDGTLGMACLNF